MRRFAFKLLLLLTLLVIQVNAAFAQANAGRGIGGVSLLLGEALQPVNLRFTLRNNNLDFGLAAVPVRMFYIGSRNFSGNTYVGYGVGYLVYPGFYGSIGYEACAVVCVGAELVGGGDSDGRSNAYANISVGMLW